jgi:hypothetical protein
VSERGGSFFMPCPYLAFAPARLSVPSIRMFSALFSFGGRLPPISLSVSSWSMLCCSCQ